MTASPAGGRSEARVNMVARIYRPAKTAMQSGQGKAKRWCLDYEPEVARAVDPLMGWTSSSDMKGQLRLFFDEKTDAIAYCERNGIAFQVIEPKEKAPKKMSYSDNFKFNRVGAWTH
jgi:hypothetical protein